MATTQSARCSNTSPTVRTPRSAVGYVWNAFQLTITGTFPAISRQVLRADVTEAPVISTRRVCVPRFVEGKGLDFEDTVSQSDDVKSFDSDRAPTEALSRGRLLNAIYFGVFEDCTILWHEFC